MSTTTKNRVPTCVGPETTLMATTLACPMENEDVLKAGPEATVKNVSAPDQLNGFPMDTPQAIIELS